MINARKCDCGKRFFTPKKNETRCWRCRKKGTRPTGPVKRGKLDIERTAPGSHTHAQWSAQIARQDALCFYCGTDLLTELGSFKGHKEHRIPLSRGGSHDISNIVAACRHCNYEKHMQTDAEYQEYLRTKWNAKSEDSTLYPFIKKPVSDGNAFAAWQKDVAPISVDVNPKEQESRTHGTIHVSPGSATLDDKPYSWYAARRRDLLVQTLTISRRFLEAAGQLLLFQPEKKPSTSVEVRATLPKRDVFKRTK